MIRFHREEGMFGSWFVEERGLCLGVYFGCVVVFFFAVCCMRVRKKLHKREDKNEQGKQMFLDIVGNVILSLLNKVQYVPGLEFTIIQMNGRYYGMF